MASEKLFDGTLLYQIIVEKFKDPQSFAIKTNMQMCRLNGILSGEIDPTINEIHTFIETLDIPENRVYEYFFIHSVPKNRT